MAAIGVMLAGTAAMAPAWAQQLPAVQIATPAAASPGWRHPDPHVWELASSPAAWSVIWRQVTTQDWVLRRNDNTRS